MINVLLVHFEYYPRSLVTSTEPLVGIWIVSKGLSFLRIPNYLQVFLYWIHFFYYHHYYYLPNYFQVVLIHFSEFWFRNLSYLQIDTRYLPENVDISYYYIKISKYFQRSSIIALPHCLLAILLNVTFCRIRALRTWGRLQESALNPIGF